MTSLVAAAERELVVNRTLDYRAPRENVRRDAQDRAIAQLFEACKLGDSRSCWRAIELPNHARSADAYTMAAVVGRQCLGGQTLACRALHSRDLRYALAYDGKADETDALCAKGLAAACNGAAHRTVGNRSERRRWLQKACDLGDAMSCDEIADLDRDEHAPEATVAKVAQRAAVRATSECNQGWAVSCEYLVKFHNGDIKRLEETATEGCEADMYHECNLLIRTELAPLLRSRALESDCSLRGVGCNILAGMRTDPVGIRDAYEHGCQLGERGDCLELVKRYRSGLPEPVPGRGRDLAEYLCKTRDVTEACPLAKD